MSTYRSLQQRFNEAGIPTHTDLIIGLPGENLNTLAEGIDELLESGCVHLNIYFLEVYPNTEMADPAYQRQFGIRAVRTELRENHCAVRDPEQTPEYVDVVVETSAMTVAEWKRMWRLAFITMLFHSLKAGFYLMHYLRDRLSVPFVQFLRFVSQAEMRPETGAIVRGELARFDRGLDGILAGWGHNVVEPDFGNVYWRIEETSLLHLSERWGRLLRGDGDDHPRAARLARPVLRRRRAVRRDPLPARSHAVDTSFGRHRGDVFVQRPRLLQRPARRPTPPAPAGDRRRCTSNPWTTLEIGSALRASGCCTLARTSRP